MEEKSIVIRPDFHCELYIDNVYQTLAKGRVDLKITGFSDGKHYLKCICTICDIVIEREINIPEDTRLEISFEDFLLQHPDCIKYQLDFAVFLEWFPKFADKWKDLDFISEAPLWDNEYELDFPINVSKGNKEGYVDVLGNDALDYYYIIREGDKYGYANGLNNIIKPCIYDDVSSYDYHSPIGKVIDYLGLTDKFIEDNLTREDWEKCEEYLKEHADEYPYVLCHDTQVCDPYSDGCALLFIKDEPLSYSQKWGIINLKKNLETPIKYNHVHTGGLYTYFGRIAVDIDGKWGLFDFEKFTQIVDCQYDFIDIRNDKYVRYYQNGLCGLMDSDGNKLTEAIYLQIKQFSDGLFRVKRDDKWGFVDEKGQECIACIFDKVDDFSGGVAKYYEGRLFGFINHKGDRLTDPIYTCSEILPNGQIKIKTEFNWGVINQDGIECLPMEYDEVLSFNDIVIGVKKDDGKISLSSTGAVFNCDDYSLLDAGHICIYNNEKRKLLYTSGKAVFADSFDEIGTLVKGQMLFLKMGGRYALYNLSEHKYITSFIYDDIFICDNGRIALNKNGMWGFLDKDGEELIPCELKKLDNWFGHISYFRGINIQKDKYGNDVWLDTEPYTIKLRKK